MKKAILSAALAIACLLTLSLAVDNGKGNASTSPINQTTVYMDHIIKQNNAYVATYDEIQWYEGEAASVQFRQHEQDAEMTDAPDGYYIVNDDPQLHDLPIAADAEVFMQIYNRTGNAAEADIQWNEPITVDKFVSIMNSDDPFQLNNFPYHITIKDGQIVKIVQQYIP
ncbi:hypothetical protein BBD42_25875 [Paenibacillus sp. BIHB 4019]|uniref:Uncharacterized protein n=1 Tax=Paenibacillus sp. BIHB 4019 TaxID=1870819 RepID=A0A1B2DPA6_9BACL|nr:hypothetical protein [Paenibacillus sp. BIHB 4019]ANY69532.1 hypothetical protein BBD42_25875 [Paenibacillus sp. BIHB 4019]